MAQAITSYDYLIVGQGLAGSLLANQLLELGQRVLICDSHQQPSASDMAAGLFNPVTGRKLNQTWLAYELFTYLHQFYPALEKKLHAKFFFPTPIYRPFQGIEEQNQQISRSADFPAYLSTNVNHTAYSHAIQNEQGGLLTLQSGWLDMPVLLQAFKQYFQEKNSFCTEQFSYQDLSIAADIARWKDYFFKKIIFCEGAYAVQNPYFNWLPFQLVKGEVLEVQAENDLPTPVIKGVFVIPFDAKNLRIGATYHWFTLDWQTTEEAKNELLEKFEKIYVSPYRVITQKAGIRPATADRRPFMGIHPEHKTLGIFNGMGAKGVSVAPFFAQQFAKHLIQELVLMPEVNIERYFSLYFNTKHPI